MDESTDPLTNPSASENDAGGAGDSTTSSSSSSSVSAASQARLTYKFQRLRERLRQAVLSGEFSGKLPGERQLARRFRVNAKTLSKALTDLAAEGLLERNIGRGTFVKPRRSSPIAGLSASPTLTDLPSSADAATSSGAERWLIIAPLAMAHSPIIRKLFDLNPVSQLVHETASLRPSFLSTFKCVIDFDPATPAGFLRDMVVRNAAVVIVGREPSTYSVNAVTVDRMLAASCLARDLMMAGHRRFVAVERRGSTQISEAIRKTAQRYAPDAWVEVAYPSEATGAIVHGATAIICDSVEHARIVRESLQREQIAVPEQVSLAAMGHAEENLPCSGYYIPVEKKAEAIVQSLRNSQQHRPAMIWLTGIYHDADTTGPTDVATDQANEVPADFPRPFAQLPLR